MQRVNRNISRESAATFFERSRRKPIIIELSPPGTVIGFRLKGTRTTYNLPVEWCFREAWRAEMCRRKKERIAARKAKKGK